MATRAKKIARLEPPPLPEKGRGAKSISDLNMRYFLAWFESWIAIHYPGMSERQIADRMGLSSFEVTSWRKDKSRPGLARAIYLSTLTGVSIDEMFGVSVERH